MTTLRVATLATTLFLLAPFAFAAGSVTTISDPAGDSALFNVRLGLDESLEAPDCRSDAADIREVMLESDGGSLTVTLRVASLASLKYTCGGVMRANAASASWGVWISEPVDELPGVSEWRGVVGFEAFSTGVGIDGCAWLNFPDGASADCLGGVHVAGDSLVWSIPLAGTTRSMVDDDATGTTTREEDRAFDLRGRMLRVDSDSTVDVAAAGFSGLNIRDHTDDVTITL